VALLASGCWKDLVRRLLLAFGAVPALAVEIANVFAALEFRLQQFDRAADYAALQLHKTSIKGDAAVLRRGRMLLRAQCLRSQLPSHSPKRLAAKADHFYTDSCSLPDAVCN
jgi:hypothetical protein